MLFRSEDAGFTDVQTYIQSGNVVFKSRLAEAKVKTTLEKALAAKMRKPFGAMIRTGAELDAVIKKNPFKGVEPSRILILFMDKAATKSDMASVTTPGNEVVKHFGRELMIHFPDGMGKSKLKIPFAKTSTGRNLNTVTKLAELARASSA